MEHIKILQVKAVRERTLSTYSKSVSCAGDVARILDEFGLCDEAQEVCVVMCLNAKGGVNAITEISRGDLTTCPVHPREFFKPAILSNAATVIFAHNHPSGITEPSGADITLSQRLKDCGELLGIQVLDSIIVGGAGNYTSLAAEGLLREE